VVNQIKTENKFIEKSEKIDKARVEKEKKIKETEEKV